MTGAQLQAKLAYRLGETSAPSDSTTKTIRYDWLSEGYFELSRGRNWWWQEATDTTNTNTGSTTGYAEPTDLKEFIELKISDIYYNQIPYKDHQIYESSTGVVQLPSLRRHYLFYRYGGRYYLVPEDGKDAATHSIKYYKRVTAIDDDADTLLIPDEYVGGIVAYAEARYWLSITQQAKAQLPFQEFESVKGDMITEQGRRGSGFSGFGMRDPEDIVR